MITQSWLLGEERKERAATLNWTLAFLPATMSRDFGKSRYGASGQRNFRQTPVRFFTHTISCQR